MRHENGSMSWSTPSAHKRPGAEAKNIHQRRDVGGDLYPFISTGGNHEQGDSDSSQVSFRARYRDRSHFRRDANAARGGGVARMLRHCQR